VKTFDVPGACTLDRASYADRLAEIRTLSTRALKVVRRDGQRLELTFDPEAHAEIEDLIRKKRSCCAFLDFALHEADGMLVLAITAPNGAATD